VVLNLVNYDALTHSYIPSSLPQREREYEVISREFRLIDRGFQPSNLLVIGPTGSGKTVTVKKVLTDLKVNFVYVVSDKIAFGTMVAIGSCLSLRRLWGLSFSQAWSLLNDALPSPVTVVIDEAERMSKDERFDELLYYLSRRPRTSVILITRLVDLLGRIRDPAVRSSLNPKIVFFSQYTADDIYLILRARASEAFGGEGGVDEGALRLIAALSAQKGGDARYSIDVLREAARVAIEEGSDKIVERHVREGIKYVEESYLIESIRSLPRAHKLMLLAALESRTVGDAYRKANEMLAAMGLPQYSERRLRDFLGDLELMGYINVKRIGRSHHIEPSKWLPQDVVEMLRRELSL